MAKNSDTQTSSSETTKKKSVKKKKKAIDPAVKRKQEIKTQNRALFRAALDTLKKVKSNILFVYADAFDDSHMPEKLPSDIKVIYVTKLADYTINHSHSNKALITVPKLRLGRMGLLKIAVVLALSTKIVNSEDHIVCLLGKGDTQSLDTLMSFRISEESELLTGHSISDIPKDIKPPVFEQVLNLAIEIGNKGKEGKSVGTIFVVGDDEKVMQLSRQMIINPFKGYDPSERNILNPALKETMRELSSVDGAFVIAGNGEIISAGRYLGAAMEDAEIPRGLGSRHLAAAGITALTNAIAVVISESTGDVRIFRNGKIIMAIEKPSHK